MTASLSAPSETPLTVRLTTGLTPNPLLSGTPTNPIFEGLSGIPTSLVFGPGATLQSFGVTVDLDVARDLSTVEVIPHVGFVDPQVGVVVGTMGVAVPWGVAFIGSGVGLPTAVAPGGTLTLGMWEIQPVDSLSNRAVFGALFGDTVIPDSRPYFWDGTTATTVLGPFGFGEDGDRSRVAVREALDHETAPQFVSSLAVFSRPAEEIPQAELAASVLAMAVLTISVIDRNENPSFNSPTAAGSTLAFTVAEDTAVSVPIGAMPAATDPEGDSFRYFFGSYPHACDWCQWFHSDVSGPLTLEGRMLRVGQPLDHETDSSLMVTVGVADFLDYEGDATDRPNRWLLESLGLSGVDLLPHDWDQPFDRVTVTVTVTDVNEPPEFDSLPESGTLSLSVDENSGAGTSVGTPVSVTDPENDTLSYSLEEDDDLSTPSTAGLFAIDSAGQVAVAAGAALDHEAVASHTVVVAVSDGKEAGFGTDTAVDVRATAVIAVGDVNEAPTFGGQPPPHLILENSGDGTPVGSPVPATDPDGDALVYSLGEDGDSVTPPTAGLFGIDEGTGQITVSPGAVLDHEAAASHTVVVSVSDGKDMAGGTDASADITVAVTIAVIDVNEVPTFADLGAQPLSRTVPESADADTPVGPPVLATDPESDPLTYSLEEDDDPSTPSTAGLFGIDGNGQVTVATGTVLDHEAAASYTVVVAVSDRRNAVRTPDDVVDDRATVVITVSDVNEAPTFGGQPPPHLVLENSGDGTPVGSPVPATDPDGDMLVYSLGEDDDPGTPPTASLFRIDEGTGQITVSPGAVLDHEAAASHTVVVSVSDGKDMAGATDSSADISAAVTIAVINVNEVPTFAALGAQPLSRTVPENADADTPVGPPVLATDPESDLLTYSLEEDDDPSTPSTAGLFGIGGNGQVTVAMGAVLDHEAAASHTVVVAVSDGRNASGQMDSAVDTRATVVITVSDVNEAPTFGDQPPLRTVLENVGAGTTVGSPVPATDPEGDTLSYLLGEDGDSGTPPTAGLFEIDEGTGQIMVSPGAVLDHESVASHTVVVSVSDGKDTAGADDSSADISATVVIAVEDVDEEEPDSLVTAVPASGPGDSLLVVWRAPEGAGPSQTYMVEYRAAGDTEWVSSGTVTGTSAMIENLRGQTEYFVRVRALNAEGGGGDWVVTDRAVETRIGVNLRVLPRVAGPGNENVPLGGNDALLLFYFTQFNGLLTSDRELSEIIVRSLIRSPGPTLDVGGIIDTAVVLGAPGGIPDNHAANLYRGETEGEEVVGRFAGFDRADALLMFYSIQFGGLLLGDGELRDIVVDSLLPPGHGRDSEALVRAAQRLATEL